MVRAGRLLIVFALALVGIGGCATVHDLYFERGDLTDAYIGNYRVALRIFAHQDKRVESAIVDWHSLDDSINVVNSSDLVNGSVATDSGGFHVSVQVVSPDKRDDTEAWTEDPEQVQLHADQFLQKVQSEYGVDSLVFYPVLPESDPIVLFHDGEKFSPRRDDYFTLQYGRVGIPLETKQLRAVLYVTGGAAQQAGDSAVWLMNRVDRYESSLGTFKFLPSVRGYE